MNHLPTVSVIVPVLNRERYIGRCIRSLLKQRMSHEDYEIIVVNDGSSDRTGYALELFAEEIHIINNAVNEGLPASVNKALHKARGRFVVRVDSDDYVSFDYLYVLWTFLEMNANWDAAACDYHLVNEHEEVIDRCNCLEKPIGCGIMFRADHLVDVGLYDPDFLLHEDRELRLRFEKKYKIHRIELPLYRYRQHEASITKDGKRMAEFEHKLRTKHPQA